MYVLYIYIIHAIYVLIYVLITFYTLSDKICSVENMDGQNMDGQKYGRTKIWTDKNMDGQKDGHICHFCPHFVRPNFVR